MIVSILFVLIPMMIVLEGAAAAGPIALEVLPPFIPRADPNRPVIGRPRVVPLVPDLPMVDWIPIAIQPYVAGSRRLGVRMEDWGRRGWANLNPY
jgi:hypothetical protein